MIARVALPSADANPGYAWRSAVDASHGSADDDALTHAESSSMITTGDCTSKQLADCSASARTASARSRGAAVSALPAPWTPRARPPPRCGRTFASLSSCDAMLASPDAPPSADCPDVPEPDSFSSLQQYSPARETLLPTRSQSRCCTCSRSSPVSSRCWAEPDSLSSLSPAPEEPRLRRLHPQAALPIRLRWAVGERQPPPSQWWVAASSVPASGDSNMSPDRCRLAMSLHPEKSRNLSPLFRFDVHVNFEFG